MPQHECHDWRFRDQLLHASHLGIEDFADCTAQRIILMFREQARD
jgi:hypothetical protein